MNKYIFAIAFLLLWLFLIASPASAEWQLVGTNFTDNCFPPNNTLDVEISNGIVNWSAYRDDSHSCTTNPGPFGTSHKANAKCVVRCTNQGQTYTLSLYVYQKGETGERSGTINLCDHFPGETECPCGADPCTTGVVSDGDLDDDGVPDCVDNDIDGDNIENSVDPDIDGDDIPNELDCDIDSDGTLNINDDDIDGDHLLNGDDPDMDGDQIPNVGDDNPSGDVDYDNGLVPQPQGGFGQPGDGKPNCPCIDANSNFDDDEFPNHEDGNIDADNEHNCNDDDVDGDGIPNDEDPDDDGDCIIDEDDPTPKGFGCVADEDDDGIPDSCDSDTSDCEDLTGPNDEPDGICDKPECSQYQDEDGDGVPNLCDSDYDGNDCEDEDEDGVCDDSNCSEWSDAGEADDDGDGIENKCDKFPTPTTVNPCDDRDNNQICDGCEDDDPHDPNESDYDNDGIPDKCDADCGGSGCYVDPECIDTDTNGICDDCDEDGTVPQCENPREDCPDYDCDYICDECDADCGGPGCAVRSDCIDEDGPESIPDGVCDDCVGGSFGGGGSYGSGGDGDEEDEAEPPCPDEDGDRICDDCDSSTNYACTDEDSNGWCDECETDCMSKLVTRLSFIVSFTNVTPSCENITLTHNISSIRAVIPTIYVNCNTCLEGEFYGSEILAPVAYFREPAREVMSWGISLIAYLNYGLLLWRI